MVIANSTAKVGTLAYAYNDYYNAEAHESQQSVTTRIDQVETTRSRCEHSQLQEGHHERHSQTRLEPILVPK
jgi:hypothetical protein